MKRKDYQKPTMNKFMTNIKTLAALLMAGAAMMFAACSGSDEIINETPQPANPTAPKTCTLTVNATKGEAKGDDATTRALTLDESGVKDVLNATWTAGDKVTVYYMYERDMGGGHTMSMPTEIGTLTAQSSGTSTTLTGEITTTGITVGGMYGGSSETHDLTADDKLYLSYSGTLGEGLQAFSQQQDGTLQTLADYFDYAGADVTVSGISGSTVTINEASAQFENYSYIIRFTLKDNAGNAISPSELNFECVTTGEYPLIGSEGIDIPATTYETNGAGVVFVQLSQTNQPTGFTGDITLTATVGDKTYTYTKSGVTFTNGKYYEITVKMFDQSKIIDLSGVTAATLPKDNAGNAILTLVDGNVLTGEIKGSEKEVKIVVEDGATVTLYNATIDGEARTTTQNESAPWAGITCEGDATITLSGANTVTNFDNDYPAIFVPEDKTLIIGGTGSLTASNINLGGAGGGAAIGGGKGMDCGNIVITGGTIIANGGEDSAAIGGGENASCGSITISGGTVTAMADAEYGGAGIGSGNVWSSGASCGDITISGTASVTARGGEGAAGIGSGSGYFQYANECGDISISGPCTVIATGGNGAAGIGTGHDAMCGDISITGGTVTAQGGENAAGIGCGLGSGDRKSVCGDITINTIEYHEDEFTSVTAIRGRGGELRPIGHSIYAGENNTCGTITFGGYEVYKGGDDPSHYYPDDEEIGGLNFLEKTTVLSGGFDDEGNTWVISRNSPT